MMRILGIDPGLRITGYGCVDIDSDNPFAEPVVVEAGVIRLDGDTSVSARLRVLFDDLSQLIEQLKPERAVVEKLYSHYAHPVTAIKMGHARGVILLAIQRNGVEFSEMSATEIKKAIVGNGHASKQQVQTAVQSICRLSEAPKPVDVTDALAMAIAGVRHADPKV